MLPNGRQPPLTLRDSSPEGFSSPDRRHFKSPGRGFELSGLKAKIENRITMMMTMLCANELICRAGPHEQGPPSPPDRGQDGDRDRQNGLLLKTRPKTKKPSLYKVLILNDDYTPMEFVVHILERFFNKNKQEATDIMLHIHRRGVGLCGIFTYEVAETKVNQVMDFARANEQPLQCTMERE